MKRTLLVSLGLLLVTTTVARSELIVKDEHLSLGVNEVLSKLSHGSKVAVTGYIIKKLREGKYLFKDKTGEIAIEVAEIPKMDVTPKTLLTLYGIVDKPAKAPEKRAIVRVSMYYSPGKLEGVLIR
jgi:uncharacterized protein YdeI (BOF family)